MDPGLRRDDAGLGKQSGYLLLPVAVAIALIGVIAFLINSQSAIEVDMTAGELDTARAEYVAQAGLQHALQHHAQQGCGPYTDLSKVAFGADEYETRLTHDLKATASYSALTDQDAWIRDDFPTNNYAADTKLHVRSEGGVTERPLYRYDLSSIPAKAAVLSARAHFYVVKEHPEGPVDIHLVTDDWTEADATWDSMGDKIDPLVTASIPAQPTAGVWVSVNLTAQVQAWINGEDNYGITLNSTSEGVHAEYGSRESANESYLEIVVGDPPTSPAKLKSTGSLTSGGAASIERDVDLIQSPVAFVQLQPDDTDGKDAWVTGDKLTWNFGAAAFLRVRAGGGGHWRSFLEFDLARLPRGARIVSAELELYRQYNNQESPGQIEVYPVSQSWEEGSSNGGANPGVTYDYRDTALPWNNSGGDFAAVPSVSFDITAATDTWYDIDITPLARHWADGNPNHGLILVAGDDSVLAEFASSEIADPTKRPKLSVTYSCACGEICAAPQGSGNLLMVVINPTTLVAEDQQAKDLFESWGYTVDVISESANQTSYDAGVAANDVVFISETVNSNSVGTKLAGAPIGVVSQDGDYNGDLGFSSSSSLIVGASVDIIDNDHFITRPFPAGDLSIYRAPMEQLIVQGAVATGAQVLAVSSAAGSLVALEKGAEIDGGTAAGRRVMLPLGTRYRFNWDYLNANGRLLVHRALEWGMDTKPAAASPGLWLATAADVSASGAPGLDAWTSGEALGFEDPNLLLEPGPTNGTFVSKLNIDAFAGDASIDALHYVGTDITVGGGADSFDLQQGDLLLSTVDNETLTSSNTLAVNDEDVFVFRPDTAGDYSAGSFYLLIDGSQIHAEADTVAISLVEKDTAVGDGTLGAGDFIFGTTNRRDVQRFVATGVGAGTTAGSVSEFIDGPSLNLGSEIRGLDLAEDTFNLGGHAIPRGAILMTLNNDGSNSGDNGLPTDSEDVFYLVMTQVGASPAGDAVLLFDGSDVALDTASEHLQALTLRPPPGGFPDLTQQLLFVVPSPGSLGPTDAAKQALFESWGYTVDLIDDDAPLADFQTAITANSVAYVSATAVAASVGSKLFKANIGVVNANTGLHDDFGFSTVRVISSTNAPLNTVASHYITQPFGGGQVTLYTSDQASGGAAGTLAADLDQIGTWSSGGLSPLGGLVSLNAGAMTSVGETTPGRRAQMPWDNLDVSTLSADGLTILQRALEWAEGANIDLSPFAHWKLDDGTGMTAIDSEGSNDGTLNGPPAWVAGLLGDALHFDGSNDYVDAGTFDVVGSGITMMAWFNADAIASDDPRFVSKASGTNEADAWWQLSTTDAGSNRYLRMRIKAGGTTTTLADSSANLSTGTWYLATGTYDSASGIMRLYLNGSEVANTVHAVGGALDTNPSVPVALGANGTAERFLDGILDDVRIYDRALDAGEISDLYAASAPPAPGYTELYEPWSALNDDTWETVDLAPFGVPGGAVVEVAILNADGGKEQWGGVRAIGSTLDRRFLLHEAEGAGVDALTLHVQADASGRIQHYSSKAGDLSFVLLGYWTGAEYVELLGSFTANDDGVWINESVGSLGLGPNQFAEIVLQNTDPGNARWAGVRAVGSGINRRLDLHKAEAGGVEAMSMMVETDASSRVQVYAQVVADIDYTVVGYWSTPPGSYTETINSLPNPGTDGTWQTQSAAAAGVPANAIAQVAMANRATGSENFQGVRAVGSTLDRRIEIHESESGGEDVATLHVQVDASSQLQLRHEDVSDAHRFYLLGWWVLP